MSVENTEDIQEPEGAVEPVEPKAPAKAKPKAAAKPKADDGEAVVEEKPKRAPRKAPAKTEEPAATEAKSSQSKSDEATAIGPPPVVRAQAKYVRSSARKARLVCDHIRGKDVVQARAILAMAPRAVASDWSKLLESAVANAEHNHELIGEDLRVKDVFADEGPTLKRFQPRAMGRATKIRKRTSHLTITLTPKE